MPSEGGSGAGWRDVSMEMVEVGKCLAETENVIRSIRATELFDDREMLAKLREAKSAARKLLLSWRMIEDIVLDKDGVPRGAKELPTTFERPWLRERKPR
jgi:hypothetical protein